LYNPTERPDDAFAETYLGGDRTEYDVVKFCCPDRAIAGSTAVWDELLNAARAGLGSDASYQHIQGNNPDGSPNPAFPVLIDVDNFIDYLINGHYHAQGDWPGNYYVIRDRIPGRTEGFKFFTWDNDMVFGGGNPSNGNKVQTAPGNDWWTESPGEIDIAIRANAEYRLRFADHAYKHYHHGGALTLAANLARWNELAALVRPALFAESARWGDAKGSPLRTVQDHWDARNANMVNHYFPNRQAVVFSQMRAHGLYPGLDAPEFSQHGGIVASGFPLFFDTDATVYYTTDGSDPRLRGGGVSPVAGTGVSFLTATTHVRARAFDGNEWSALNEATFIVGVPPDASNLAVSEIMYHPGAVDPAGEFIELLNLSSMDALDLTGVSFSDGIAFAFPMGFTLPPGARAVLVADPVAFATVHPGVSIAGTFTGSLDNGGERIALTDSFGAEILSFTYDDRLPWPEAADGGGPGLVLIAPENLPDPNLAINWRSSTVSGGNPAGTDRVPYLGGDLAAYALAGPVRFDVVAMSLTVPLQAAADDAEVLPQWSTDLRLWNEGQFRHLGGSPARWQILPPVASEPALFLRAAVKLRQP
ncbi:MAG: lamin tail domain-containing protein, partial [Verrucomicrobiae bacterium]|nr:lamin tail domain-containing protein [Verrucomicrobiae bacterium]